MFLTEVFIEKAISILKALEPLNCENFFLPYSQGEGLNYQKRLK